MRITIALLSTAALFACASSEKKSIVRADPPPNYSSFRSPGLFAEGDPGERGVGPQEGVIELKTAAKIALAGEPGAPLEGTAYFLAPENGGPASKLVVAVNRGAPGTYDVHLASSCGAFAELRDEDTRVGELVVDPNGRGLLEAVVATEDPLSSPALFVRRSNSDQRVNLQEGQVPGVIACSTMPTVATLETEEEVQDAG